MLKSLRTIAIVALAVASVAAATLAKADPVDYVDLTFASGATFIGTVTFTDDYSSIVAVDGTLTGYEAGTTGYVGGSASDMIDWVWNSYNYALETDEYGNFLVDGPNTDYWNWIAFTYNYSGVPVLTLAPGDNYGVEVDYDDPLVNGSISSTATPEPGTLLLFGSSLVAFGGLVRRKIGLRSVVVSLMTSSLGVFQVPGRKP